MIRVDEIPPGEGRVPMIWQVREGAGASVEDIAAWLSERRERYDQQVRGYGALLLRGFSAPRGAVDFEALLEPTAPVLQDYVGGTSPRKVVRGKIMTATEVPGIYSIPLHQEMSYTARLPARISFFCVTPAARDGQTTLGNMREITERLDDGVLRRFEEHGGVQLRRNLPLPEQTAQRPGVPKPWTEVFGTTDRDEAGATARQKGWRAEWLDDGSMQLWQEILPAMRPHPDDGQVLWCNQIHIFAPVASLRWALNDGRADFAMRLAQARATQPHLLDQVFYGDGSPITDEDVLHIARTLDEAAWPLDWRPGDFLMLDNMRVGHGRRQYQGGRSILTALIGQAAEAPASARAQPAPAHA
ncbi:TauD/TfdA family dioxygenase [Bordetella genomosp. 13]|uniref:TauD/TfdA family dioxygenase n=1 Tax=Bordetella genomosp. 13 TaxID=463040 RepID=UPI00119EF749|nr:TauD/TfdA family dioxygenase [Bordetella genomosp. 13]